MVEEKTIEKLEDSAVKLSITVPQSHVRNAYDELVKKYAGTAQIKGFRKGKVPRNILERKFGEGFRAETLQNVIEEALGEVFKEIDERPLPYAQPSLVDEDLELNPDEPLAFSVTYDVFPDVTIGPYEGLTITEPKVKITKKDEDQEIENLRQQNALVIEKDDGTIENGDIVTLSYVEIDDDDTAVEGTERNDYTYTVGEAHNFYHLDTEVLGMKSGESKVIDKSYPDDFEHEELRGQKKRLKVDIAVVKQRDVPALDDEFAQDVSDEFETLDDLRKDVKKRLKNNAEQRKRAKKIDDLVNQVVAASEIPIPKAMIATELEQSWRGLAEQYRATPEQLEQLLSMQGKTRDEIFDEWAPSARERLKRSLLVQKLIEKEEIEISDEEAETQIREDAAERKADAEQILEYYRNNNMLSYVKQELAERKLFDRLLGKNTVKSGDSVSYMDLMNENE